MNVQLTDTQWQKILPVLQSCPEIRLGAGRDCRPFLEAVLWILRSGAQVSDGFQNNMATGTVVYNRFANWSRLGIFEKLFEHFSSDRVLEYLLIDSTIVRSHACAAGAKKTW